MMGISGPHYWRPTPPSPQPDMKNARIAYGMVQISQNYPPQVALGSSGITCYVRVVNTGTGIGQFDLSGEAIAPNGQLMQLQGGPYSGILIDPGDIKPAPFAVDFNATGLSPADLVSSDPSGGGMGMDVNDWVAQFITWHFTFKLTPLGLAPIYLPKSCWVS